MKKFFVTFRIAIGLVGIVVSATLLGSTFNVFPDRRPDIVRHRRELCESLAINFAQLAKHLSKPELQENLQQIVDRSPDVWSIGIRLEDGKPLLETVDHQQHWPGNVKESSEAAITVPIYRSKGLYGNLEVSFEPLRQAGWSGIIASPEVTFSSYMLVTCFLGFTIYLRTVLTQLNPRKAVPKRVREALDTLSEGLLILDQKNRIVHANLSFERVTGYPFDSLLGRQASDIPFVDRASEDGRSWYEILNGQQAIRGRLLELPCEEGVSPTFSVSFSPILDDQGAAKGVICSFEDVTELETQKRELATTVDQLNASAQEIRRQNRELEVLATRDPLTGCCNRRYFFQEFDSRWSTAKASDGALSVFMVDIDHFKSINDTYGHAVGDDVLRDVANALERTVRNTDLVSRYGGEEFAILLSDTMIDDAVSIAENIREQIEQLQFDGFTISASLGVSSRSQGALSPQDLLEQADKCLYVAKRNGRNQVIRWDDVPPGTDLTVDDSSPKTTGTIVSTVPFHAVTALISALAYRDQATANHSRRVADLCVLVAEGLLPIKECYLLEIAGLLHDIGKIGIPDSILLKPGKLTEEEIRIMHRHDRIGTELIRTSFACEALTEIVDKYRVHYDNGEGNQLPIGARILAIADAFDSMTTQHAYRQPFTPKQAFAELRRCAGHQFDPELVERFIYVAEVLDQQKTSVPQVSKDVALSIGLQMEQLAAALDARDANEIGAVADRLRNSTIQDGVDGIPDKAAQVTGMCQEDADLFELVRSASELLDMCRLSQRSLLDILPTYSRELTAE